MRSHVFRVVLDRGPTDAGLEKFIDGGAKDATFGLEHGLPIVEFDREAESLSEAIVSAVRDLEDADMVAVRVLDEDLVTLADIADRIGQSRESVRRYATGHRGPGGFPPPVNPARDGTVFYRWSEVGPWMSKQLGLRISDTDATLVMANLILQIRCLTGQVDGASTLTSLLAS